MKLKSSVIFLIASLLLINGRVAADSYYSTLGLGMPNYFVSPQAAGMGGAGIAVRQYLSLNEMNPAGLDLKGFTMIAASFQGEITNNTVNDETIQTRQGQASGFRFVVPLKKNRLALVTGLKPRTKSQMSVQFDQEFDDLVLSRLINTSGGLSSASIGFQYSFARWLQLGGLFDFNFGAFNETWKSDFNDDTYRDTQDDISSHMWGTGFEFGLIFKPHPILSFGGMLRTSSTLHLKTTITPGSNIALEPIEQEALYPMAMGFGAAVELPKILVAADYYRQDWAHYKLDGRTNSRLTTFQRFGAGVEYVDAKDYLVNYPRRIAYRLGGSWAQLPFYDASGVSVKELMGTIGAGFPFNKNLGRIDISLEIGKRFSTKSAPYSEHIYRISASVTSAEQWFRRVF